jgi:hypothetical protein
MLATPKGSTGWEVAALEPERFLGLRMSVDLRSRRRAEREVRRPTVARPSLLTPT